MIVIADDLTGANDTGVQFVNQGRQTVVHLIASLDSTLYANKVNVFNTDSRSLLPEEAYNRNKELARKFKDESELLLYKKIDSTLRGNIGQEIDGLMDELAFSYCAVVPAYPQNGRKTIGGYHLVHGELLEDSGLAEDLKSPMTESYLPSLLEKQTTRKIGLISLRTLRNGEVDKEVRALQATGVEVIIFDSATDDDLKTVTEFLKKEEKVLWVGSAGLAQAFTMKDEDLKNHTIGRLGSDLPTLTIAGSVSDVTREQIAYQKEQGIHVISLHPLSLLKNDETSLHSLFLEAKRLLDNKEDVVITTVITNESAREVNTYAEKLQLDKLEIGNRIATRIGTFASQLIKVVKVSGLILTGGDIAYQTCLQLDIHALEMIKEVEEGIPLSKVIDGDIANTVMVTKAGAFGQPSSLYHAMQTIKGKSGT